MKVTIIVVMHLLTLFAVTHSTDILRKLNRQAVKKVSKSSKSMQGLGEGKGIASTDSSDLHFMMDSMSLDLSLSMSLSTGKSGKKGGHSSKASKGSKASKSDKKSSKKGSDFGKEDTTETPASSPNGSDDARPPVAVPSPSSSPPSMEGLQTVQIPRYGVSYILSQSLMPMREDYLEVEAVTNEYFNAYMLDIFEEPGVESLIQFRSTLHTSEFIFNEPVLIFYDSVAYFAEDFPSESLPSAQTLQTLLELALEDPSDYLDLLAQLGVENAFTSTTDVAFADDSSSTSSSNSTDDATISDNAASEPTVDLSEASESTGASLFAIAAGAIGASLLVAGVIVYRRRRSPHADGASFRKSSKSGHCGGTVAGDTFTSESCDGLASRLAKNIILPDEEAGEPTQSSDFSSVSPTWDGNEHYGYKEDVASHVNAVTIINDNAGGEGVSHRYNDDESFSDDIMSVGTADLVPENTSTERTQLSVAEIEAMLYSQF